MFVKGSGMMRCEELVSLGDKKTVTGKLSESQERVKVPYF